MKYFFFTIFAAVFLFFSCKTTSSLVESTNSSAGEEFFAHEQKNYFIAEIDLSSPEIEIKTYPKAKGFSKPISVKKFAEQNNCFAAINTNPFITSSKLNPFFSKRKPVGLYVDNFSQFSEPQEKYAALAFFKEEIGYSAKIFDSQSEIQGKIPAFAVGGFWTILRGEKIYSFKDIKDFRSAAGISEDGKKLYLFCGKNLSYEETAKILKEKNVFCAMQLDGGPSSQLYYNGKNRQKSTKKQLPSVILGFSHKPNNKIDE
ncbi:MAG: phosphodiester glycosidase family protein [Treponema sp.]|nr:phosphodiester glycosidase family protein [Treponema sp.]